MHNNRIDIYFQSGDNFAFMLGTAITSLYINASKEYFYNIFIASGDMSEENKNKFYLLKDSFQQIKSEITFIDASSWEEEIRSWGVPAHRNNYVTYYKLLIDRYFKDTDVERLISIGTDTLVTGDLHELVDFDFDGHPIAMNWSEKLYERRFKRSHKYCVAEMVYFNLKEWRAKHCEERLIARIKKYGDIYGSKDQGLLNTEFQNDMAQLPLKYNIYGITYFFEWKNKVRFNNAPVMTKEEIKSAYEHPEIIHIPQTFVFRPHEKNSLHPLRPMWWDYCHKEQNPWKDIDEYPSPKMGSKEKFLRYLYVHLPKGLAEWVFIVFRHGYGWMNSVLYPYHEEYKEGIKQIFN